MLFHNSHDSLYRSPTEAAPCGSTVTLRFNCDESDTVTLRLWDGAEHLLPMHKDETGLFAAELTLPREPMLLWYDFIIPRAWDTARYGAPGDGLGGIGQWYPHQPPSFQLTVYDPAYTVPEYLRTGIMYQIFPDRFSRSSKRGAPDKKRLAAVLDAHHEAIYHESWEERPLLIYEPETQDNQALDFFGGTLRGIREKLDYLQSLGVTVLYLNPIFRAHTNHRYDTGSYEEIDPILGTKQGFHELLHQAHARGIRILLDGVFSHTGADSLYFNRWGTYDSLGAYQSQNSPYSSWFTFRHFPDDYRCWWGFKNLPELNKNTPSCEEYFLNEKRGIVRKWLAFGADGWRLDVADELPVPFLRRMRACAKAVRPDSVLLGEVWEDASNKVTYGAQRSYCLGDTLDSVMNYPLRRAVIDFLTGGSDAHALCRLILHQREVYPAPFFYSLMNLLGSHDRVRALNAFAGWDAPGMIQMDRTQAADITLSPEELRTAKCRYLQAMKLLCALPGIPCCYYGDEIGMTGMSDPWNRAPMDWNHADEAFRAQVSALFARRKSNPLFTSGWLDVSAPDGDTLIIRRYLKNGLDRFGEKQDCEAETTVTITRL